MNWSKADSLIEGVYLRSESVHSRRFYQFGIRKLKEYCDGQGLDITQENLYESLQGYVSWLKSKGLKPKTILDYVSGAKRFIVYLGIDIDERKFHNFVIMPRVFPIEEEPLEMEDVRRLLTVGKPNMRTRALILTLLSSGMRLSEALKLNVKDLELDVQPARARLRAEITKAKQARVAYLSEEAVSALSEVTEGASLERLVFDYGGDIWSRTKIATVTFRRVAKRAGLDERIPNHRIHKVHFHIFRKYFLTKGCDTIGEHAAHKLCGHGFYMETYYRKFEAELEAAYTKLVPKLMVFGPPEIDKDELLDSFNKRYLAIAGYSEEEITKLGNTSEMTLQELQNLGKQKSLGMSGNQKVVPMVEVEQWVEQRGWDFVTSLPDNKAIVRLPSLPQPQIQA